MKTVTWLLCLLVGGQVYASHLRGGYIQAKSTGNLQYEITITVYTDGPDGQSASSDDALSLCFGDGSNQSVARLSQRFMPDRASSISTYRVIHTYAGPGTYTLSAQLSNPSVTRNSSGSSEQEPMILATTVSTSNGANRTPTLLLPETGSQAAVNQRLDFPFKATDADGDSLVYSLTRPLTNTTNNTCVSRPVATYQFPNDVTRRGTFKLDNRTGNLTWDAPVEPGNYSVAITVGEFRNGILISQTLLEIVLAVVDRPGTPGVIPPYEPALEGGVVTALPDYRDEDVTLTVFPNPVDDRLQIVVQTSNLATVQMQLLDANGRLVHDITFGRLARRHEQVISMSSLTPGVYVVRANVGDRTLVRKVMKR